MSTPARTVKPLTETEISELAAHEATIENGKEVFLAVGSSLLAIQETALYRETHVTFQDYLAERWPTIGKAYAYRLISAAKTDRKMESTIVDTDNPSYQKSKQAKPKSESQYQELAKDDNPAEAWEAAQTETGKNQPTAKEVAATVEKRKVVDTTAEKPKKSGSEKSPAPLVDGLLKKHLGPMVRGIDDVAKVNGGKGPEHRKANMSLTHLENALREMRKGQQ